MVRVIGIRITDRIKEAGLVQRILSAHAGVISTRLGFHELNSELCGREGYMVIHLAGQADECDELMEKLKKTEGIDALEMVFSHGLSDAPMECEGMTLLGIMVPRRDDLGIEVQDLLTTYGCVIRTRLGVNEVYFGEPAGLIILELAGDRDQFASLEKSLREIEDIAIGRICFPA
jgi:nitrate reductase NapAB chaperone NapD